jgi:hypothetical protein
VWLQLVGVRDCNQELCVVAKNPDFVCVVEKATWLFGIWLQAWVVCDCKKIKCVIAKSAGLFLWLQKKKKKTKQVCDCNYLVCVIANQKLCVLQKNLTLSVCLQSYLVVWNMIASLDSVSLQSVWLHNLFCVWLQKTKVCDCKICWFISVTAKKEKEKLNKCVIATIWRAWLQNRSYVCCKKTWLCLCACKATWLFGIWLQAWIVCHCKKLKCVIAQPVFYEFNIVDVLASAEKNKKCFKHKLLKWACDCLQQCVTCDCIVICLRLQ